MPQVLGLSASKVIHIVGALSCIGLIPLLFQKDDPEDKEDSEFLHAVRSNNFENMIWISFALAIPSCLDVLTDILEHGTQTHVFDDSQLSRLVLTVLMFVIPPLMYYFGIVHENIIATYTVRTLQSMICATVVFEHLHVSFDKLFTFNLTILILFLWNFGCVIEGYSIEKNPTDNVLSVIATASKGMCTVVLVVSGSMHMWTIYTSKQSGSASESRYERWHTIALHVLIFYALAVDAVLDYTYGFDNMYNFGETYLLGTTYMLNIFQFLFAYVIMQKFRFDLVVAKEKLSIKRQFVRYVSHEVRTPLNSCSLGLSYLKNLCEKKLNETPTTQKSEGSEETTGEANVVSSSPPSNGVRDDLNGMLTVIDEIADCCDTAVNFMNNMLFYEKIDTLDLAMYFKSENLQVICNTAYNAFLLSSRHLGIDLSFEVHESLAEASGGAHPFIRADYSKINVVLRNLLSNAMKFSSPGGKVRFRLIPITRNTDDKKRRDVALHMLDASPSKSEETTTHYRVIVEDEGIGMTAEEQKNLFSSVIQFNPNESQSGGGSGLGLYLSQKIVRDHNATIEVYSEGVRGRGSKFFIDFLKYDPDISCTSSSDASVRRDEMDDQQVSPSRNSVPHLVTSIKMPDYKRPLMKPLHELSIMIVDDSVISRKMLQRALDQNNIGGQFEQAGDGVELLNIVCACNDDDSVCSTQLSSSMTSCNKYSVTSGYKNRVHPSFSMTIAKTYDIIVIDKSMPLMDGDVATAKLREWGYEGLIIGLTGNALEEDLKSFCDKGANYAFSKPLDMEQFLKTVQRFSMDSIHER
jgi:signal transduction histidine kinase